MSPNQAQDACLLIHFRRMNDCDQSPPGSQTCAFLILNEVKTCSDLSSADGIRDIEHGS